ncbi:unnamed protein product [Paramecium octaurelia]|uniref:Uncharacterized protein n=1 Tax=Paramecium octaurelia TaxID=43137 RepID=A0A8S1XI31_PAROT|nr:unnamed protein product [Paramecium octaurelia]
MSQHIQASVQFSFPKASRFQRIRTPCQTDYYEPNYFRSTRASGFGYGKKFDFTKIHFYTETYYDPTSSFSNHKGTSFGLGRDLVKYRTYYQGNRVPGPGAYNKSSNRTVGFKIGEKLSKTQQASEMPGPGTYDPNLYKQRSISINKKPERFSTDSTFNPGPGEYFAQSKSCQSKGKFGNAQRKCFIDEAVRAAEKSGVPGPGNYDNFTQFVQLEKSHKRPSTAKN